MSHFISAFFFSLVLELYASQTVFDCFPSSPFSRTPFFAWDSTVFLFFSFARAPRSVICSGWNGTNVNWLRRIKRPYNLIRKLKRNKRKYRRGGSKNRTRQNDFYFYFKKFQFLVIHFCTSIEVWTISLSFISWWVVILCLCSIVTNRGIDKEKRINGNVLAYHSSLLDRKLVGFSWTPLFSHHLSFNAQSLHSAFSVTLNFCPGWYLVLFLIVNLMKNNITSESFLVYLNFRD